MKKIVIKRGNPTFKVVSVNRKVDVKKHVKKVTIKGQSKRGLPGEDGQSAYELALAHGFVGTEQEWFESLTGTDGIDGAGVPTGGLPGEMLVKKGTDDFDTEWATVTGRDKYYVQAFNTTAVVTVNHNLAKYPSITVHDSAGDEVEGTVVHNDINTSTIVFSAPFSGLVTCN